MYIIRNNYKFKDLQVEDLVGTPSVGIPTGGTTGQALAKLSNTDYDVTWSDFATPADVTAALAGYQPLDADLTAIAALSGSSGFLKTNGVGVWSVDASTYLTTINGLAAGGELAGTYPNPTLVNSAVISKVLTGLNVTGSSLASTDSILQAFGKLQNQINALLGGAIYQSTWNPATNTPTLVDGVGTKGYYYVCSANASINLGSGAIDFNTGDWAIYNGTIWQKVDNTDAVSSVNGYIGAVSLTTSDIAEGTRLYFTNARSISATLTGYVAGTGVVSSADSVLQAIQKIDANANAKQTAYTILSTLGALANTSGALINDGIGGLSWSPTAISQWTTTGTSIYYNTAGGVAIGKTSVSAGVKLDVFGGGANISSDTSGLNNTLSVTLTGTTNNVSAASTQMFFLRGNAGNTKYTYMAHTGGDAFFLGHYTGASFLKSFVATNTANIYFGGGGSLGLDGSGSVLAVLAAGGVGIKQPVPTAYLHIGAGTATSGTAPIKLTSGTNLTTAVAGCIEYNGTNLFFTRTGSTRENVMCASAVNVVSPTSPNRTITVNVDGTTYYLHAKTTND